MALLTVLLTTGAKVARWAALLPGGEDVSGRSLARALLLGQLINAILPARLGEAVRFYTVARDEGLSKGLALGSIAAEKVYDVLFLLVCAGMSAALTSLPSWLHGTLAVTAGLGAAVVAAASVLPGRRIESVAERVTGWLPDQVATRVARLVEQGVAGLESLRRPDLAARACAWSVVIWALALATNVFVFRAFELPLSVGAGLLLLTVLQAGMVPPSSPARLGVFHAITVVVLGTFRVGRETALAYAMVLHGVVYGPLLMLGLAALAWKPNVKEGEG
jgi:hypothetical protein